MERIEIKTRLATIFSDAKIKLQPGKLDQLATAVFENEDAQRELFSISTEQASRIFRQWYAHRLRLEKAAVNAAAQRGRRGESPAVFLEGSKALARRDAVDEMWDEIACAIGLENWK